MLKCFQASSQTCHKLRLAQNTYHLSPPTKHSLGQCSKPPDSRRRGSQPSFSGSPRIAAPGDGGPFRSLICSAIFQSGKYLKDWEPEIKNLFYGCGCIKAVPCAVVQASYQGFRSSSLRSCLKPCSIHGFGSMLQQLPNCWAPNVCVNILLECSKCWGHVPDLSRASADSPRERVQLCPLEA